MASHKILRATEQLWVAMVKCHYRKYVYSSAGAFVNRSIKQAALERHPFSPPSNPATTTIMPS
jgi:hypothetical protein